MEECLRNNINNTIKKELFVCEYPCGFTIKCKTITDLQNIVGINRREIYQHIKDRKTYLNRLFYIESIFIDEYNSYNYNIETLKHDLNKLYPNKTKHFNVEYVNGFIESYTTVYELANSTGLTPQVISTRITRPSKFIDNMRIYSSYI